MSNLDTQAVLSTEQGRLHLRLSGEMDLAAQPLLDKIYRQLVAADPGNLTVDLTEVTFLASNGLGFLAQTREHLHATGHTVTLHGPDRAALRALHIMGFDQYFTITD